MAQKGELELFLEGRAYPCRIRQSILSVFSATKKVPPYSTGDTQILAFSVYFLLVLLH
jgi:hypothetical protein